MDRLLVGKEVEISVGEPWDFESPNGQGLLRGRVAQVIEGGDHRREQAIEIEVTPFTAERGHKIARLRATRRYADTTGIIEQVASGERAPANLSYSDQVPEGEGEPGTTPKLIGSVRLAY